MPKTLILTAPYGSGHARVSAALAQAFGAEGAVVETADHFERFVSPGFARASLTLFWAMLRWVPRLWGLAYGLSAKLPNRSIMMSGMDRLGATALRGYLDATRPDVVMHVHPTSAGAMAWLRGRGETEIPHGIVLTEFVAHPQWIYAHLDRYFAPTDEIRAGVVAAGVSADRVVVSGIPIDPGFAMPADRAVLREELDLGRCLHEDAPVVLVTSGMRGSLGGIAEVCDVLAELVCAFRAVVVCGHHARLQARLRTRFEGDARFRILGRVAEMHRVMGAADLVVTKAGAVTCAEALALELPLVFHRSLPGQERANEDYLVRAGAGVHSGDRAALRAQLLALIRDPARRGGFAAAARRIRRPEAGRTVAKEMLALAGGR